MSKLGKRLIASVKEARTQMTSLEKERELVALLQEKLGKETFALLEQWLRYKLDDIDDKIEKSGVYDPNW